MKFFVLALISAMAIQSHAGQEGGGGGHPCKADFMQIYTDIKNIVKNNQYLLKDHPYLKDMLPVLDPKRKPKVNIEVLSEQIQNCPLSQNPVACANPKENKISLFCGGNGWMALNKEEKLKHVVHELLWWSPAYDDSNFYYTTELLNSLRYKLYGNHFLSAAYLKPSEPVIFEIDLSEIEQFVDERFKFTGGDLTFRCSTFQPSYVPMTHMNSNEDESIYQMSLSKINNKLVGSFEIKKEAWLESPPKESNLSSTQCDAGISLIYRHKIKDNGTGSNYIDPEEIIGRPIGAFARVASEHKIAVNLTESLLEKVKGSYKLSWVYDGYVNSTPDKKLCRLLISKKENGIWYPTDARDHTNFPCPKNFKYEE